MEENNDLDKSLAEITAETVNNGDSAAITNESGEKENDLPPEQQNTPTFNEHELKAMEKGWKPKEQFSGDPSEWKPAKQWLEFGELLDTVHTLKRKDEEKQKQIETVLEISKKAQEKQREQILKELKQQHREAVEIGDVDAADKVVEEIHKIKNEETIPQATSKPLIGQEDMNAFMERNKHWFNDEPENFKMRQEAIDYDAYLLKTQPSIPPKERFERVERMVKSNYPQKFENPRQNQPSPVMRQSEQRKAPEKTEKISINDLPPEHKRILRTIKPEFHEQYIQNCKLAGLI